MKAFIKSIKDKFSANLSLLKQKLKATRQKKYSSQDIDASEEASTLNVPSKKISSKEQILSYLKSSSKKFKEVLGYGIKKLRKNDDTETRNAEDNIKNFSLNFDEITSELFHPNKRKVVHQVFIYALLVSTTFTVGKILGLALTPTKASQNKKPSLAQNNRMQTDLKQEIDTIRNADIFNSKSENNEVKKASNENIICLKSESESSLPVKLLSTVVLQDSVKSVASVQVRGEELVNLREGERIQTMAEIGKIDRLKVVIKNLESGECEYIGNDKEKGFKSVLDVVSPQKGRPLLARSKNSQIQSDGKKFTIKKGLRDEMLNDISKILTQARAIQIKNPDGTYCYKMTEIEPGSVYSLLDIQEGDTVCEVNGNKISDINVLMNMFGRIKEIENFSLGLSREGEVVNKSYQFVD